MKKTIMISGCTSGIGREIVYFFLNRNYRILGISRKKTIEMKKLEKIKDFKFFSCDLTNFKKTKKIISKIKMSDKKIDYLITNVGGGKRMYSADHKNISYFLQLNFFTAINLILASENIKSIKKIVCISSITGTEVVESPLGYGVSKSALNSFVKYYSTNYTKHKKTINIISPGNIMVKGGTWDKKLSANYQRTRAYIKSNVPTYELGLPETISNLINYILKDKSKFINGSNFIIDGGQTRII